MSQQYPYSLEVTRALWERARIARFSFGEETAIVAVQHLLRQTIDLFRTIAEMGVNPKNILALGKVERLWEVAAETLGARRVRHVIVLDDGRVYHARPRQYSEQIHCVRGRANLFRNVSL